MIYGDNSSSRRPRRIKVLPQVRTVIVKCQKEDSTLGDVKGGAERKDSWVKRKYREIALVVAVLTIIFGFHEFLQHQWGQRVERSLQIYERYQSGKGLEARLEIQRLWNSPSMWTELAKLEKGVGELRYWHMREIVGSSFTKQEVRDSLYVIWSVFREAGLCLAQRHCDQYTICKAFWVDAQKTYYFSRPYFDAKNRAWDETIQSREKYEWELLNRDCGSGQMIFLFEKTDFGSQARRYVYELFNVHETGS